MTTTPASAPTPALDRFFATLRRSSVTRSSDRVIAGVAAGVAARLGVSPAIVRVAIVGLAIFGPGVLLYLLAWLMLPDAQGHIRLERAVRGGEGGSILLLVVGGLALLGALFGDEVGRGPGMHGHGPWPLLIVAGIALLGWKKGWWQRHTGRGGHGGRGASGHHQQPSPTAAPSPTTATTTPPATLATPGGPQDAPRA
ncbi:MAG: PspC domain-containing protein [Actinomycetota bacterium]|nr:PspC domain-containing protein [Actinomycetota bacterium]